MNKTVGLIVELALIAVYLVLVIFIIDTSNWGGLVCVAVATFVIFPLVLFLEKKREKTAPTTEAAPAEGMQQQEAGVPAEGQQPVAGQQSQAEQQAAAPPVQPVAPPVAEPPAQQPPPQ